MSFRRDLFQECLHRHLQETLDVNNEAPMTIAMTFSAENITLGNAELDNRWPRS